MVCSLGNARMAALARLQALGSGSQTVIDKVGQQKLAAQYTRRELYEADEANFLDEEDMHIFGLRPMTDPLNLVCCNKCKKPIKTSQYIFHAELCKSLDLKVEITPEPDQVAVKKKKPPRKERKKLPLALPNQVTLLREPKTVEPLNPIVINSAEPSVFGQIQGAPAEAKRNSHPNKAHKMNGAYRKAILCPSKPLKRATSDSPLSQATKILSMTAAKVLPYVPAPLATKIYYSQRNNRLRRAIGYMFHEEYGNDTSHSRVTQANMVSKPTPHDNIDFEQITNQQGNKRYLHLPKRPDQIISTSSEFVPSMNVVSQLPVNNSVAPHYMSS